MGLSRSHRTHNPINYYLLKNTQKRNQCYSSSGRHRDFYIFFGVLKQVVVNPKALFDWPWLPCRLMAVARRRLSESLASNASAFADAFDSLSGLGINAQSCGSRRNAVLRAIRGILPLPPLWYESTPGWAGIPYNPVKGPL